MASCSVKTISAIWKTICGWDKKGCHSCESRNLESSLTDPFVEIIPGRVIPLYQFQLPCSFPFFYLFLPLERRFPGFVDFIPNQAVDIIFPGKTVHQIISMLVYSLNEVGGYACI